MARHMYSEKSSAAVWYFMLVTVRQVQSLIGGMKRHYASLENFKLQNPSTHLLPTASSVLNCIPNLQLKLLSQYVRIGVIPEIVSAQVREHRGNSLAAIILGSPMTVIDVSIMFYF